MWTAYLAPTFAVDCHRFQRIDKNRKCCDLDSTRFQRIE
jgi:hypothetical protein